MSSSLWTFPQVQKSGSWGSVAALIAALLLLKFQTHGEPQGPDYMALHVRWCLHMVGPVGRVGLVHGSIWHMGSSWQAAVSSMQNQTTHGARLACTAKPVCQIILLEQPQTPDWAQGLAPCHTSSLWDQKVEHH